MDYAVFGLTLLTILMGVGGAAGTCEHVKNEDMLEYSCEGGRPEDLYSVPTETEKIRINKMNIPIVTADTFSRFGANLWVLACSNCGIIDIEPDAFRSLINLQQLSLDDNHLTVVKGSWFEGLDYLTYLDLNYNRITTIEDEVYENLPNLVDLRLSGNRFECLNVKAMENLKELKRIFLSENREFKCPITVGKFLEERDVIFSRDPEWRDTDEISINGDKGINEDRIDRTEEEDSNVFSSSTSDYHSNRIYFPTVEVTTEDTKTMYDRTRYPLYAPVSVTTSSDYNYGISQFSFSGDSTSLVSTTDKPELSSRHQPTLADPDRSYTTTKTTMQQPSRYPSTRPWPIARKDETTMNIEYHERFDYYDEVTGSSSLATSPTNLGAEPIMIDPNNILSTQQSPKEIYYTPNGILIEPNYPLPNPTFDPLPNATFDPQFEENDMETINTDDISHDNNIGPYVPPPIQPEIVQPAAPSDFLQVPYYEPTVTIRRPLSPAVVPNYDQQQQQQQQQSSSITVVETTTDKPFPECPNSSSMSFEFTTTTLLFLTVLLNIILQRF